MTAAPGKADARRVVVANRKGLHARASARFVKLAQTFDAEVTVSRNGAAVSGRSIMGLMMLAAGRGDALELAAVGPEAQAALDALETLVAERFGED